MRFRLRLLHCLQHTFLDVNCRPKPFLCGSDAQYFTHLMDWLLYHSFTSCIAIFSILSEIFLSTQRLLMIRGLNCLKSWNVKHVGPVLATVSLLYYLPVWFSYEIKATDLAYVYKNQTFREFDLPMSDAEWLLSSLSIIRIFMVMIVLLSLNILSIIAFNRYLKSKSNLKSASLASKAKNANMTKMLIGSSLLYVIGTAPHMLNKILTYVRAVQDSLPKTTFVYMAISFLIAFPGFKFFIYFGTNFLFRKQFMRFFNCLRE
jgi:hypothetical protein